MRDLIGNVFGYEKKSEANAKIVIGALTGILLGATAGLLFAPQSGKETREDIAKVAEKGYGKAVEASQNVANYVRDKSHVVSEKIKKGKNKAVKDVADTVANVADDVADKAEEISEETKLD